MCQKMKKPVNKNANETASDRRARLQARLNDIWQKKGLMNEDARAMGATRYDHGVRSKSLPEDVDEEHLKKRNVKFECIEKNRETPLYSFTWKAPGAETTLTVDITEKDILSAIDRKIEEKKARIAASLDEKMNGFWAEKGLVDENYQPLARTRHSNSLEERKKRSA